MESSALPNNVLILGFFDGIHIGHRKVISSAVDFAKKNNYRTTLLTFTSSPAEYFGKHIEYIYERNLNYKLIKELGVDNIVENDFSKLANISAINYLETITKKYSPKAIFSGFNYTFGKNKEGNPDFLKKYQKDFEYNYFQILQAEENGEMVSSTLIKKLIQNGELEKANILLSRPFSVTGKVIKGTQTGRTIGFPTANIMYPENIVKLPFGVYKVNILNKSAVANWGIKPTLNGKEPILEVHIPDYSGNLYGQVLTVEFIRKIRDERKFDSLDALKIQIKKDLDECLKL